LFLTLAQSFLAATFLGVREFRVGNRMYVLTAVVNLLAYGGMFLSSERDAPVAVVPVLMAGMLAQLAMTVVWLVHYVTFVRTRPALWSGGGLLRPAISFSLLGYFAELLNQLNYRLDIWILGDMRDMGELGLYAVAVGVAQFFFMVPEPIARVLQPHLVSDDQEGLLEKFKLYSRLCISLVLVGGGGAVLVSEWVFPLVYGELFRPSAAAFRLLMPGIVFASVSKMLVLLVVRTGKIKYNVLASGAGLVVTLVFDLLLIPKHGLLGAAVASTLAYFTVMAVVAMVVFLRLGVPFGNYFILTPKDVSRLLGRAH
jgi:O-antigen/teichoic acid export membrane protein